MLLLRRVLFFKSLSLSTLIGRAYLGIRMVSINVVNGLGEATSIKLRPFSRWPRRLVGCSLFKLPLRCLVRASSLSNPYKGRKRAEGCGVESTVQRSLASANVMRSWGAFGA